MIFVVICMICAFLATASAIVPAKESGVRVPLTDQLLLKDLQPTLDTLKKYYYKGGKWQALCLALGLTDDTIGVIETNHIKNVELCLKECLSSWLRKEDLVNEAGGPNWETLISALRSIGENAAAEEIDKEKQPACIIFDKFYKRILSSIRGYPEAIAILLHKEEVISDEVLKKVETHKGMGTDILLDEVHNIVYKDYKNVQKLAVILKKFTATALIGKSILEEY
uniref:Death domain-containing protein n=1 Tax=Amphimedon queenslandica TaxID=400682 RepID=A0A1X7SLM7_AMPQE